MKADFYSYNGLRDRVVCRIFYQNVPAHALSRSKVSSPSFIRLPHFDFPEPLLKVILSPSVRPSDFGVLCSGLSQADLDPHSMHTSLSKSQHFEASIVFIWFREVLTRGEAEGDTAVPGTIAVMVSFAVLSPFRIGSMEGRMVLSTSIVGTPLFSELTVRSTCPAPYRPYPSSFLSFQTLPPQPGFGYCPFI